MVYYKNSVVLGTALATNGGKFERKTMEEYEMENEWVVRDPGEINQKGNMMYTVTIREKKTVVRKGVKRWEQVRTTEEATRLTQERGELVETYGYTPEIDEVVTDVDEVYSQSVETLDLPTVIKAINGID